MLRSSVFFLFIGLVGCAPLYTKVRPEIEFHISDISGAPVKGAMAVLTTRADPHNRFIRQESFKSEGNGVIKVDSKREWELVIFTIHGSNYYFWPWCIQAPGYQRVDGKIRAGKVSLENQTASADASAPIKLSMEKEGSDSSSECFTYPN